MSMWGLAGGVLGGAVGMVGGPMGVAAGASIGSLLGGALDQSNLSDAEQQAALAQQNAVSASMAQQSKYAAPTASDISSLDRLLGISQQAYSQNMSQVSNLSSMMSQSSDLIKNMGAQASRLSEGKDAAILAPLKRLQETQKQNMSADLAKRLGPGWESSSAGIEAMTMLDLQHGDQTISAQQQATSQALQGYFAGIQSYGQLGQQQQSSMQNAFGMQQGVMSAGNMLAQRQIGVLQGGMAAQAQTADAQYTGQISKGKYGQQMTGALLGGAMSMGSSYVGGKAAASGATGSAFSSGQTRSDVPPAGMMLDSYGGYQKYNPNGQMYPS